MTYHHTVVSGGIELAPSLVGDGDVADRYAGFEGEFGDNGDGLVRDEIEKRVFGLRGNPLCD